METIIKITPNICYKKRFKPFILFILLCCKLRTKTMTFNVSDSVSPGPYVISITVS